MRLALLYSSHEFAQNILVALQEAGHVVHSYDDKQKLLLDIGRESFDLLLIDGSQCNVAFKRFLHHFLMVAADAVAMMFINCDDNEAWLADALSLGADDFIHSRTSSREILARINAVLRRRHPAPYRQAARLVSPPYFFDLETGTVQVHDTDIPLTRKEFDLAVLLFHNLGRLLSRGHLLDVLWHGRRMSLTRTVDAHISRLRKRLMIDGQNGHRLVAAYGSGYRLEKTHDTWVSPLLTVDLHAGTERP